MTGRESLMDARPVVPGKVARGRSYRRKFDHDEARRRHAAGETLTALAKEYGVTPPAVKLAVDPKARAKSEARAYEHARSHRCECGRPAFKRYGVVRCVECARVERRTSVREDELRCVRCRAWRPDAEFPSNASQPGRRGRHAVCRSCQATMKREWRERHPEARVRENKRRMERYFRQKDAA